ncbi:F-box domain-containing protein [uncultured Halopseudomonas sp.]|uniref:F-box domain-containing protein n=1 Tax=uncultured Halopseudomonas sp. TaxID=2901193 RepID=UPI0030EE4F05|tara:strand:- start:68024 stop:68728 length:705 start_codon:yes stop_codon:yes gene_type:complete
MLNAVFAGKKRGSGLESQHYALDAADGAEDVLTASVFERLAYLPDDLFSAVFSDLLNEPFGPLHNIDYWPSWFKADGTRVEPDLLVQDAQVSVLVEAKRHDYRRQQCADQLANELVSGWHQNVLPQQCIVLTLGGLENYGHMEVSRLLRDMLVRLPEGSGVRFKLVCRSWQQLYQALETNLSPESPPGCFRLLDDIAKCYAWHGLRTHAMRWLRDLPPRALETHPGAFSAWSIK